VIEISVDKDKLVFEVLGLDKLWSLKSRLAIPLDHIEGAAVDPDPAMGWFQGVGLVGTNVPNVFKAGTFIQEGGLIFWDVSNPEKTIVVDLDHEHYKKLIIEVADPAAAVKLIQHAIS
jgi:hypothetical protein